MKSKSAVLFSLFSKFKLLSLTYCPVKGSSSSRGCNPNSPYYLFKRDTDAIYLNMLDGEDPKYVNNEMINPALDFIHQHLIAESPVFVYCSLGESRSPSIALMYLLENNLIEKTTNTLVLFKREYYPLYNPKNGNLLYIKRRWGI